MDISVSCSVLRTVDTWILGLVVSYHYSFVGKNTKKNVKSLNFRKKSTIFAERKPLKHENITFPATKSGRLLP
jgi:hypothetical protein